MENKTNYFDNTYMPRMHRIGKLTGLAAVLLSFGPAAVLAFGYGLYPSWESLITAFISIASAVGVLWFVEPLSYFPVIGPVGTYMAFVSGNISNMRIPCASVAQVSANVKPGTPEGSIVATLGMAVSVIINNAVLSVGVVAGSQALAALPPEVTDALNYLLPALFGALLVQFGMKQKKLAIGILAFAIAISYALNLGIFNWLPGASNYLHIITSIFLAIGVSVIGMRKNEKAA
jgi:hypothetical protein